MSTSDFASPHWAGRTDGDGPEHRRWHQAVSSAAAPGENAPAAARAALIGFACDAGVARNRGRVGAAGAPAALRTALGSLAFRADAGSVHDAGDVVVHGDDLEAGQQRLGETVAAHLGEGRFVTVLGGGHETAYGTYLGLSGSGALDADGAPRLGILNLDAHFDLREDPRPSSGTPFLQIAGDESAAGRDFQYGVVGISRSNNTTTLFKTAERLGVQYLLDEDSQERARVQAWVEDFAADVDVLYLTIDLDVLPAAVAPGVSAPAGYGVPFDVIRAAALAAARTGKLAVFDVVELNPEYDVDARTARSAARLIDDVVHAVLAGA
ncbi:formimidoylglutamase [Zhihengliuella sp.]|uniref:formimidoylglutamase n=1 Tax=Zhihengliuella sp. TaxID=1954483 RepID=UPI002810E57A|nr:formimidoylglutamase [Zhihengliuella sp.]